MHRHIFSSAKRGQCLLPPGVTTDGPSTVCCSLCVCVKNQFKNNRKLRWLGFVPSHRKKSERQRVLHPRFRVILFTLSPILVSFLTAIILRKPQLLIIAIFLGTAYNVERDITPYYTIILILRAFFHISFGGKFFPAIFTIMLLLCAIRDRDGCNLAISLDL